MIFLTGNRTKSYSVGIICADILFIFYSIKLVTVMRAITKSFIVAHLIFSSFALLAQASIFEYEGSISEYESNQLIAISSPFREGQLDSYVTQGINLREAGQHDMSLVAFQKAWEIDRIQNGLYSESQVSIIDNIISSYVELEKWDSVNEQFEYLEHLYGRIYEIDNPKFELGLKKISSWHVNALNENLAGRRVMHLRKVHHIFKARLNIA